MSDHPIMKCGCAAQGTCSQLKGKVFDPPIPSCIIHDCIEIDPNPPSLTGRTARCSYYGASTYKNECGVCSKRTDRKCMCERPSEPEKLPFFEHHPKRDHDSFYCGCHSWD